MVLSLSVLPHSSKSWRQCYYNVCITRREIKTTGFVLYSVFIVLVRIKCMHICELWHINHVILLTPHELNALIFTFETGIHNIKGNIKKFMLIILNFKFLKLNNIKYQINNTSASPERDFRRKEKTLYFSTFFKELY